MQLMAPTCVECHGKVKYSGLETGNVPWKNGKLVVQLVNGVWRMNLEYDVGARTAKSYVLSPGIIKKLICKAQLVIELQPDGRGHTQTNLHVKPQYPNQIVEMQQVYEKLQEIQKMKDEPIKARAEVKMSSSQLTANSCHDYSPVHHTQASPETFTRYSVKSKESRKRLLTDDSDEEEGKENKSKSASEIFLERGCEKSKAWISTETTPIKFYGHKSPGNLYQSTYPAKSIKRGPGLMPDPTPTKKRLSGINYSWLKPKLSTPSEVQQQQNLHGFSNLGNTCYMNAILQSLVNLDTFSTDLLFGNKKILRMLEPTSLYKCMELVFNSRIRNIPDFSKREYLKNLKQAISSSAKRFSGYQQHDAHEFLGQLLDQLKEEVTKISKSTPSPHRDDQDTDGSSHQVINPTVQNFEFEVIHRIKCEDCGEEVTKEEQFNDLSIDMPRSRDITNPRSLQDALEMSLQKENIEYTCEKCSGTKAGVSHKFTKLPRVLVLHLKRYSYNMLMSRQAKAGQNIAIPRYLTLQSHCEDETRPPYPTIPPPEPKSLSVPDSPLREKNENTPRRRLDTNPTFRFKKIKALPDFDLEEDTSKTASQQTSTPNKKLTEEPEVITDRKLTLEDDFDDPELAKALELSLKEANERAQGYYDEVDGMVEDNNLKRVLEMSRHETIIGSHDQSHDHDYENNLRSMTEEEQIELAMKRSMMEFEILNDTYQSEDIRKECSSAYVGELFNEQEDKPSEKGDNFVRSKYFKNNEGSKLNIKNECDSVEDGINMENNYSPTKNTCDEKSTYELTENSYFHSHISENNNHDKDSLSELAKNQTGISNRKNSSLSTFTGTKTCSDNESSGENEVMVISDINTDSDSEICAKSKTNKSSSDISMEISDPETNDVKCDNKNNKMKSGHEYSCITRKVVTEKSKDIQDILMVDQMTSNDIKHVRKVEREVAMETETNKEKSMDIVDLFCNEEDDLLISQWDKENYNPDNTIGREEEELLPRIDNEKGELPYSYRLVSIVNHIGSSSVVGHYVSDVYDIKKSSWFSCDDSHVSRATETEVRSKRERSGYIFFYLHKDIFDDLKDHYAMYSNKKEIVKK